MMWFVQVVKAFVAFLVLYDGLPCKQCYTDLFHHMLIHSSIFSFNISLFVWKPKLKSIETRNVEFPFNFVHLSRT